MNEEEITILQQKDQQSEQSIGLRKAEKEVEELKSQLGERDATMGELQRQLAEAVASNDASEQELASLKASLEEKDTQLASTAETLSQAVERYRASLVAANPEIPQEMIAGEAIADIDISLEKAKALVEKVASSLERRREEEARATSVPTGAPERSSPDFSSMSAREKIEYAIRKETE
ncbi:MAG: hypothetical protein KAT75_00875 [Dehalococcoidia bacterium]|nr:hypothetical protein [Dehalococcoidia bacterium]